MILPLEISMAKYRMKHWIASGMCWPGIANLARQSSHEEFEKPLNVRVDDPSLGPNCWYTTDSRGQNGGINLKISLGWLIKCVPNLPTSLIKSVAQRDSSSFSLRRCVNGLLSESRRSIAFRKLVIVLEACTNNRNWPDIDKR